MNTLELKSDLHNLIDKVTDVTILKVIKAILSKEIGENDFWDELPESVKESIELSLDQASRGETISHEQVLQEMRTRYGLNS